MPDRVEAIRRRYPAVTVREVWTLPEGVPVLVDVTPGEEVVEVGAVRELLVPAVWAPGPLMDAIGERRPQG